MVRTWCIDVWVIDWVMPRPQFDPYNEKEIRLQRQRQNEKRSFSLPLVAIMLGRGVVAVEVRC